MRVLHAFSLASHCEVGGSEAELALCCQCNRHTPDAVYVNVFLVNSFLFCGESRWCVPGRHCLLLKSVTFVPACVTDVFTKVSPREACKLIRGYSKILI